MLRMSFFGNNTHTSQHHENSIASHAKNVGNPTVKSDTQTLNALVTPNKSHIPIKLIELNHDSPLQHNQTKLSDHEKSFEDGLDSVGCRGPFMEAVDKECEQDLVEILLIENEETLNAKEDDAISNTIPTPEKIMLTKDDILPMNTKEMKSELKKRNLKISGNKQTLQVRLQNAVKNIVLMGPSISASVPVSKGDEGKKIPTVFPTGAYWKVLYHEYVHVIEPRNLIFKAPHAPTVLEENEMDVPTKYNPTETFDIPVCKCRMVKSVFFGGGFGEKPIWN